MDRRIPAITLLAVAAAALVYALYMLIAPTELILRDTTGAEVGRVDCSTGAVTGGLKAADSSLRAGCDEAAADEQLHALVAGAVVLVAGAAGGLLLVRRRTAVVTPQ